MTTTSGVAPTISSAQQQALYDIMNGDAVSDASGVSSAGGSDGSSPPTYLTPQALMAYCQTRLQGISSQVQTAMTQQQNADWEQSSIGSILQDLSTDSSNSTNGIMNDPTACQALELKLENLITRIQQTDPGCSQLGALEQLHDSIMSTGAPPWTDASGVLHGYYAGGDAGKPSSTTVPTADVNPNGSDGQLSTQDLTNFTSALNNINSSLGQDGQLNMINVESLMSEQTTAITLATNIIQSIDDGTQKIADKIGT